MGKLFSVLDSKQYNLLPSQRSFGSSHFSYTQGLPWWPCDLNYCHWLLAVSHHCLCPNPSQGIKSMTKWLFKIMLLVINAVQQMIWVGLVVVFHFFSRTIYNKTDVKGKVRETFMPKSDICLFNDDTPTYLRPATGCFTSIDLTTSDHFHIISESHYHPPDDRTLNWQFH